MIAEINKSQKYLHQKFGTNLKPGVYAVPVFTSKGHAFMRVVLDENNLLSDFELFKNKKLTIK